MNTVEAMLEVLARGEASELAKLLYESESLSDLEREVPVRLLASLRPTDGGVFGIVERHVSGDFELLILDVPWQRSPNKRGSGYHPLLVSREPSVRIIGFVLPWNELLSRLPPDAESLGDLSAEWIAWIMAIQAAH